MAVQAGRLQECGGRVGRGGGVGAHHGGFNALFVEEVCLIGVLHGRSEQEGVEVAARLHCDHHVLLQHSAHQQMQMSKHWL